jgi:hypothetical protein
MGTRDGIAVERGGTGDRRGNKVDVRRRGQYIDSFDVLKHEFHKLKAEFLPHTRYLVKR